MCQNALRYTKLVKVTTHACKRFWDYTDEIPGVGQKDWTVRKIRRLVARRLANELRKGLFVDKTGAVHVPIDFGLYAAVIFPPNGYLVVTFHKNERNIDIKKLREEYNNS